ncbi:trichothecene 3-o-acetyltransferase [Fusarium phyllophilum]|uniref:Trichothecene 3-o-acetyltransferase n=1 Tax=Fusarium phyllophilum TaxID=47803 RepID=A0A8H5K688_9HYPO|nr:trichothecene 3-o-acetyltransferase [Fusarium phyllophilum]
MFDLDKDIEIDPLTNRVYLGEYHNLCFVFHAKPSYTCRVFISRIHKGLVCLSKEFPWIAGQVHYQGASKYKISPFQVIPRFQVENLPNIPPFDFSQKEDEDWPMGWINKNHVPIQEPLTDSEPSPVMELKFTLSQSASILTVSMNSKVVDRTGLIMMVRMLAEACGGKLKKLPSSDVLTTEKHAAFFNIDKSLRHDRIPIMFVPDPQSIQSPSFEAKDIEWALFTFDRQAVQDIRDLVLKGRDSPSQCFVDVDTYQAFSAFVFRNICCARDDRLTSGWTARYFRAVDARNALGVRTQTAKGKHLGALLGSLCRNKLSATSLNCK